jgi:hypothetical protein
VSGSRCYDRSVVHLQGETANCVSKIIGPSAAAPKVIPQVKEVGRSDWHSFGTTCRCVFERPVQYLLPGSIMNSRNLRLALLMDRINFHERN